MLNFENEDGDIVTVQVSEITDDVIASELERVNKEYSFMGTFHFKAAR